LVIEFRLSFLKILTKVGWGTASTVWLAEDQEK
jgi:hypothetical protein